MSTFPEVYFLGWGFNQPIGDESWPASLKCLAFGNMFNQRLGGVSSILGEAHLRNAVQPEGRRGSVVSFAAGAYVRRPAVDYRISWPTSLQGLIFGVRLNPSHAWPTGASLKEMTSSFYFSLSLQQLVRRCVMATITSGAQRVGCRINSGSVDRCFCVAFTRSSHLPWHF